MQKHSPVVHRVELTDVSSSLRDPRLTGLLADGWTVGANWVQRDGIGEGLMLLLMPPSRTAQWTAGERYAVVVSELTGAILLVALFVLALLVVNGYV